MKEEVDIPQNIPDEEVERAIYRGQEMLRMLMCDEFYQDFLTKYHATPATPFSAAYTSLFPYIKQFIAHQAYEYWVITCNLKPTRSGIRVHTEENSVSASDVQMSGLIKIAKQSAQYYKRLLIDFIEGNPTNYPLYCGDCSGNNSGNGFHISAVKNKHKEDCGCSRCRC